MKKHSPLLEEKLNPRAQLWRIYGKVNPDHTQRFLLVSFHCGEIYSPPFREQPSAGSTNVCFTFCIPVALHTSTQCRESLGRTMLPLIKVSEE